MPGNGSETSNGGLQRDRAEVLPPLLASTRLTVAYYVFDVLELNGVGLIQRPLGS